MPAAPCTALSLQLALWGVHKDAFPRQADILLMGWWV